MVAMPPDRRSARRVSELRTEPLWGLQCDSLRMSGGVVFYKAKINFALGISHAGRRLITASANCSVDKVPPMSPVFSPSCNARS